MSHERLSDEALAELEQREARRTAGPWRWWTSNSHRRLSSDATGKDGDVAYGVVHHDGCADIAIRDEDLFYVEAACNALPSLLAEVRRLRAVEAAARALIMTDTRRDWNALDEMLRSK
jgi:hypothetical protein